MLARQASAGALGGQSRAGTAVLGAHDSRKDHELMGAEWVDR